MYIYLHDIVLLQLHNSEGYVSKKITRRFEEDDYIFRNLEMPPMMHLEKTSRVPSAIVSFYMCKKPCVSSSEESRSVDDKSDYVLCELQAVESESEENVVPSLTPEHADYRSDTPEHDDRLVNLEKNVCESARVLAICARELRQLEEIKQEKERLTVQLTELNAYNDTLRNRVHDLERQCASDDLEKNKVLKLYEEAAAELTALKETYEDMKIKADTYKDKFLCMKTVCDEFQEKKTGMAEKIKECSQIIKEKTVELEQALAAKDNAILAQRKAEEELTLYKTEKHHTKAISRSSPLVENVEFDEPSNLREDLFVTVRNKDKDQQVTIADSSSVLSPLKMLSEQRVEISSETPVSDFDFTTPAISSRASACNQAPPEELEITSQIISFEHMEKIITDDHKDVEHLAKNANLISPKPVVKTIEILQKPEEDRTPHKLFKTPRTKTRPSSSIANNIKIENIVSQVNLPQGSSKTEATNRLTRIEKPVIECAQSLEVHHGDAKKMPSRKRKVPCLRNLSLFKRPVKVAKQAESPRRKIQEMLDIFKRIFDEIQPLLEPLPSTFKAPGIEEEIPNPAACVSSLDDIPQHHSLSDMLTAENVPPCMLDLKISVAPTTEVHSGAKKESSKPIKRDLILRDAAQPVTHKILESKLSPESLLISIFDSKMDFQSVLKRFSEEELVSIRTLSTEDFGKIMAEAAIRLQTGDMWMSVLDKFRTRHVNAITNRTEENLIEVSNKLCSEHTNFWFPFIKRLWLMLVSQPNHSVSFCCRLTRYICLAVSMEVQLQHYGNSILYSKTTQFFHSLLTSMAFQYPQYLSQILIFTIIKTRIEHMKFLNTEVGENICKILAANTDIHTRDMMQWYWQSSYGGVPLRLFKYFDSSAAKFYTVDMQKYTGEPLRFTENGFLKMDEDLARRIKLRALAILTPDGQTSLCEDFEIFEKLLHNACLSYAPNAVEVDSVIGKLFSTTTALGDMNIIEARSLVVQLYSLIYFLPILTKSSLVAAKIMFIKKFEAAAEKCYIIRESLLSGSNVASETRTILLDALGQLLKLAPKNRAFAID